MPAQAMPPVRVTLLGWPPEQEVGSGVAELLSKRAVGVQHERKACWVETGRGEQAWAEAGHRAVGLGCGASLVSAASRSGRTEILPPCSALSHKGSQKRLRGGDGNAGVRAPPWGEGQWVSQSVPGAGSAVPPLFQHTLCRGPRPGGEREEPPAGSASCLAWAGWSPPGLCAGGDRPTPLGGCCVMELLAPPGVRSCSAALCPGSCSGTRFAARFLQRQS